MVTRKSRWLAVATMGIAAAFLQACSGSATENKAEVGSQQALPPAYLSVSQWQQCTSEKDMGSWKSVCLPQTKPANCPAKSWDTLQQDKKMPGCQ
ncbi:hypothetical protein [Dongshaea marina]|uniref:hypothetical protein n=1 Tax=Dongshaea marina TaxID=2047966 RepID=UPI000D3EC1BD|nr:hypothetical protein [Dongshaea marina]